MSPRVRLIPIAAMLGMVAMVPAAAQTAAAPLTNARCELGNSNGETFKGPCIFTLGAQGSFSITRPGNARVIEDDVAVMVQVIRPGVADVTARTRTGTIIDWGPATRGANGSACWRGTDFWICVYALDAPPARAG